MNNLLNDIMTVSSKLLEELINTQVELAEAIVQENTQPNKGE